MHRRNLSIIAYKISNAKVKNRYRAQTNKNAESQSRNFHTASSFGRASKRRIGAYAALYSGWQHRKKTLIKMKSSGEGG